MKKEMFVLYAAKLNKDSNLQDLNWNMIDSVYFETSQEADLARIVCSQAHKNKIFTYRKI